MQGDYRRLLAMNRLYSGVNTPAGEYSGTKAGGGTAFWGYSSSTEDAIDQDNFQDLNASGKYEAYRFYNDTGHSGTVTKLRIHVRDEYYASTVMAAAIYADAVSGTCTVADRSGCHMGSRLVRFNAVNWSASADGYYDMTSMADAAPTLNDATYYWVLLWNGNANSVVVNSKVSPTNVVMYGSVAYSFAGTWPADGDQDDCIAYYKPHIYVYISY